MKHVLFYLLFIFSLSFYAKEAIPTYYVTKSELSKTLKKTDAVFVFTFFNGSGKLKKEEISFSHNSTAKKQRTDENGSISLTVKPGKYVFQFLYDLNYYEITTDSITIKPGFRTEINVTFTSSDVPVLAKKPVIYFYPKQKEDIAVQLNLKGEFTFTYPEYTKGWNFSAEPDGTLHLNNKKYHYLFWDGKLNMDVKTMNLTEGFIVDKKDLVVFFEKNLTAMGLNSQEMQDYITYWCPLMNVNEKNYIHFMFNADYNKYAALSIKPAPDQLFRVFMLWTKATERTKVKPQKIETFKRGGFTVVEWGGTGIENILITPLP